MAKNGQPRRMDEQDYRSMVESVTDTEMIMLDVEGNIRSWNRGAENLKGYTAEEVIGKNVSMFYTPDDANTGQVRRELETAERSGRFEFEGWRVRKGGAKFWAEVVLQPIKDDAGKLTGFVKLVRDITERKRNEDKFRAVVESAPTAMIMINKAGEMMLINAQAEKLFGYGRDEMMGKKVEMLVPQAVRGRHPGLREGFFHAPVPRVMGIGRDLYGLRKDGSEIPVELGLNPIRTAEGDFVLAAIADITERKRNEEKFRAVVESAPTAMVMINKVGEIMLVNAQAEKMFGYRRDEMMGKKVDMLVPQSVRGRHPALRDGFFRDPTPRSMGIGRDLYGVRKDGTEIPVEIGLNPIKTADGDFVLAAIADITERRRVADQMNEMAKQRQGAEEAAQRRNKELERLAELERFQKLTVGRELKMIELKKEIEELKRRLPPETS